MSNADFTESFDALTRQPVVDALGRIRGYELLYRRFGDIDASQMRSGMHATCEVLCTAAFSLGLEQATDHGKPLYVNVDGPTLMSPIVEVIDPHFGVIELLESITVTREVRERIEALHSTGYRFALDDVFSPSDERLSMLHCVDIVKVDMHLTSPEDAATLVSLAHIHGKLAVAEKLEDDAALAEAHRIGFDLFQGYRTGMPAPVTCLRLPVCTQHSVLRAYRLVRNESVPMQALASSIANDPALALRLWLLANVHTNAQAAEIANMRELVGAIPRRILCAWLAALLLTAEARIPAGDWHYAALAQARFLQLAARRLKPNDLTLADSAYLLGLIAHFRSTLTRVFRDPVRRVRSSIGIEDAAAFRTLGALLDLALGWQMHPEGWYPETLRSQPGSQGSLNAIAAESRRWARKCCLTDHCIGTLSKALNDCEAEMLVMK